MTETNPQDGSDQLRKADAEPSGAEAWNDLEILEQVAAGGMGVVYKAMHKTMQRFCAVKVLPQEDVSDRALRRFRQEARLMCTLDHPNIVKVFAFGYNNAKKPYFVMEWLEGKSLETILSECRSLPANEFCTVFRQVLSAVGYAHKQDIIHRDLKPANIFLLEHASTGSPFVKLLDFGIARIIEPDNPDLISTRTALAAGTPLYMSPEASCNGMVDPRSDIYSLGAVMYEALSGTPPFCGDTALDIMYKHARKPVDPGKLPRGTARLNQCILKCLAKDPQERYQNVAELQNDFDRTSAGLEQPPSGRKRVAVWTTLAISTLCLAALSGYFFRQEQVRKGSLQAQDLLKAESAPDNASPEEVSALAGKLKKKADELKRMGKSEEADKCRASVLSLSLKAAALAEKRLNHLKQVYKDRLSMSIRTGGPRDKLDKEIDNSMNFLWNVYVSMAELLESEGKLDEAAKYYDRAIASNGGDHYLYSRAARAQAKIRVKQGRLPESIAQLQKLLKAEPYPYHPEGEAVKTDEFYWENSCTELLLAGLLQKAQRIAEAKHAFSESLRLNSLLQTSTHPTRSAEALIGLAACDSNPEGKRKKLLEAYNSLCSLDSSRKGVDDMAKDCCDCARLFEGLDRNQAGECYRTAFSMAQQSGLPGTIADTLKSACEFENDNGNFQEVSSLIENAKAEPGSALKSLTGGYPVVCESQFACGVRSFLKKDLQAATAQFQESKRLADSLRDLNPRLEWMLGRCCNASADQKSAREHFSKSLEETGGDADFLVTRNYLRAGLPEYAQLLKEHGKLAESETISKLAK